MKKPIHMLVILGIVAAFLTLTFLTADSNAIQIASNDEASVENYPRTDMPTVNSRMSPITTPTMAVAWHPQPNHAQPFGQPMVQMNWERIQSNGINGVSIYRAAVPGGWLITTQVGNQKAGAQIVFVPDVIHGWGMQAHYPPNPYQSYPNPRTSYVPPSIQNANRPQQHYAPHPYTPPQGYSPQNNVTPNASSPNHSRFDNALPRNYQPNESQFNNALPRNYRPNESIPKDFNSVPPHQSNQIPDRHQSPSETPEISYGNPNEFYPPKSLNPKKQKRTIQSSPQKTPTDASTENRNKNSFDRPIDQQPKYPANYQQGSVAPRLSQPAKRQPNSKVGSDREMNDNPRKRNPPRKNNSLNNSEGRSRIQLDREARIEGTTTDLLPNGTPIRSRTEQQSEPPIKPATPLNDNPIAVERVLIQQKDGSFKTSKRGITLSDDNFLIDGFLLVPNKPSSGKAKKNRQPNAAEDSKPKLPNRDNKATSLKKPASIPRLSKDEIDVDPSFDPSNEPVNIEATRSETSDE